MHTEATAPLQHGQPSRNQTQCRWGPQCPRRLGSEAKPSHSPTTTSPAEATIVDAWARRMIERTFSSSDSGSASLLGGGNRSIARSLWRFLILPSVNSGLVLQRIGPVLEQQRDWDQQRLAQPTNIQSNSRLVLPALAHSNMQRRVAVQAVLDVWVAGLVFEDGFEHVSGPVHRAGVSRVRDRPTHSAELGLACHVIARTCVPQPEVAS